MEVLTLNNLDKDKDKINILIVEDSTVWQLLMSTVLSKEERFNITVVGTLKDALFFLENQKDTNIILLDLNLPDSDSKNTLEQMSKVSRDIPVIIITGQKDALEKSMTYPTVQDFIEKSNFNNFNIVTFLYTLKSSIKHTLNILQPLDLTEDLKSVRDNLDRLNSKTDELMGKYK